MPQLTYSISSAKLNYSSQTYSVTIDASSGNGHCLNNASKDCLSRPWEGSIPIGMYTIFASEVSAPNPAANLARNLLGDWGSWRVPLHPHANTRAFGRDGFFLHGGNVAGSAGCIDIGGGVFGSNHTELFKSLISTSGVITLRVIK